MSASALSTTPPSQILLSQTGSGEAQLTLSGRMSLRSLAELEAALAAQQGKLTVDLSAVERFETSTAWALVQPRTGLELELTGATPQILALIETVRRALPKPDTPAPKPLTISDRLANIGKSVMTSVAFARELTGYLGLFLAGLARGIAHPASFRMTALVHHCQEVGLRAVPIVALMSFLIGVVIAFQGATLLTQFGAEVYVVDLISVSILRELGILLTAIVVAGRTASAFTAAIGSMKMREEIDAMRTLGIDPAAALIVPRVLALLLMLPILGLIADVAGIFGGGLMSWISLGISPGMFVTRLVEDTSVTHAAVGLLKAPVFALIIALIGCLYGMKVGNNAESLGQKTSAAVVASIFSVIVADAMFSIFFAEIGW